MRRNNRNRNARGPFLDITMICISGFLDENNDELPRQARDKCKETTPKKDGVLYRRY